MYPSKSTSWFPYDTCPLYDHIILKQQQQQLTPQGQNQIAQQPSHQQQQTRYQHEAQTPGNCAKLAAEEFATLGKFSGNSEEILILLGSVLLEEKY